MKLRSLTLLFWLTITCCILSGCQDATFHNIYGSAQERQIGEQESAAVDKQSKFDQDLNDTNRVQSVASAVFVQAQKMRPDLVFSIKIIDSPEVNAFSIAGGHIYIYTGLLDKLGNDDDALACVIGHEATHIVLRHELKQMTDSGIKGDLVELLGITTENYNLYNAAQAVYELDQLHYSREDEYAADKYGLMFAYNAGYDPYGSVRLFKILEALDKATGTTDVYASDHPISKNRELRAVQLIKTLRANDGTYPGDPVLASLQTHTSPAAQLPNTPVPSSGNTPAPASNPVVAPTDSSPSIPKNTANLPNASEEDKEKANSK